MFPLRGDSVGEKPLVDVCVTGLSNSDRVVCKLGEVGTCCVVVPRHHHLSGTRIGWKGILVGGVDSVGVCTVTFLLQDVGDRDTDPVTLRNNDHEVLLRSRSVILLKGDRKDSVDDFLSV